MKKKVGIVTLNGYFNYGNRLQNYALQEVLISFGFDVTTIVHCPEKSSSDKRGLLRRLKRVFSSAPKDTLRKVTRLIARKVNARRYADIIRRRTDLFMGFTSRYISENKDYLQPEKLNGLNHEFDYFVTGSDQVWNPSYNHGAGFFFLTFADSAKRIAYAPSFGVPDLSERVREHYSKWLSEFACLSVRENEGARLIKQLCGRDTPVVLDPTMLLNPEKWDTIADRSAIQPPKRYLLTYFIGSVTKEYKTCIDKAARELNLQIVNLGKVKYRDTYATGPAEFLAYIRNSTLFFTDSFHGSVFSIIFEKPFIVFKRIDALEMQSRLDTLLDLFQLQDRQSVSIEANGLLDIDYTHAREIMKTEQEKAFAYLELALGKNL